MAVARVAISNRPCRRVVQHGHGPDGAVALDNLELGLRLPVHDVKVEERVDASVHIDGLQHERIVRRYSLLYVSANSEKFAFSADDLIAQFAVDSEIPVDGVHVDNHGVFVHIFGNDVVIGLIYERRRLVNVPHLDLHDQGNFGESMFTTTMTIGNSSNGAARTNGAICVLVPLFM